MSNKTLTICLLSFLALAATYCYVGYKFYETGETLFDEIYELHGKAIDLNHAVFDGKLYIAKLGYSFNDNEPTKEKYDECLVKIDSIVLLIHNNVKYNGIGADIEKADKHFTFCKRCFKFYPNTEFSSRYYEYYNNVINFAKKEYAIYSNIETDCHELFDKYTLKWIDGYNKYAEAEAEVERAQAKLQKEIEKMRTLQKTNQ